MMLINPSLTVHQDGSCNGLQHYAALGGDAVAAEQVNLTPSPRYYLAKKQTIYCCMGYM